MRRFLIFTAALALIPAIALAQGRVASRGMASGMSRPAMSSSGFSHSSTAAPHVAMRAFPTAGARSAAGFRPYTGVRYVRTRSGAIVAVSGARQINTASNARASRPILSEDVPGLGFDYAHLAAVHPRGNFGHIHGHVRGRFKNQFVGAYFPFYGGGYYLPLYPDDDMDYDYDQSASAADAQPVVGNQEAEPVEEQDAQPSSDVVPHYSSAAPARKPDTDEYVFVRRDGTLFFATAFAWENGSLRYITREGLRRTLPLDKLDLNATQQFNEQRGLNFRLPA